MKDSLDRIDFATRRKGGVDSRIVIVCEYSKSGQIVARTANGVRQTYEYDKKGQLLAVKDSDGNALERYAYDKAGNMLKKQILRSGRAGAPRTPQSDDYITTTFTFDDANQLVSSTTDGVTTRYTYDAAGRLVKEGSKTYRYGYLDKVLSVTDGDTTRTFTYHADGQLASASCDGIGRAHTPGAPQTETFLWDGLALIQRGDEQFVNEPHVGGGNPVASSKGTSYFNDALGTTVGSKSNGKYSAAALTAFGENYLTTQPPNHQTFFTGKPYVEGLGHAFLMRNYRAGLAKWQTADPMGYPDGWNQLAYCNNGVTSAVDLWGCIELSDISSDAGIIERVLLAEVMSPAYGAYNESKAKRVMKAIVNCIYNRKNYSNPELFGIHSQNPSVLDVVTAPGQFDGFSLGADGTLELSSSVEAHIQAILDSANQGVPGKYYRFVEAAKSIARGNHASPFTKAVYAFRTAGASGPGGRFDRIWNVDGQGVHVLLGQKFYTLE